MIRTLLRHLLGGESPLARGCPCGHAASFHRDGGGCRHTHDGSTDCYGYCTCPRSFVDVADAEDAWEDA